MSDVEFTTEEWRAVVRPARFRYETFQTVFDAALAADPTGTADLPEAHRSAADAITTAQRSVSVETFTSNDEGPSVVQWFWGPDSIIECCYLDTEIVTFTWPLDGALLATRIAITVGLTSEGLVELAPATKSGGQRVEITASAADDIRSGRLPSALDTSIGHARNVTILASQAPLDAPHLAYEAVLIFTASGAWRLDAGEQSTLESIETYDIWDEIASAIGDYES